MRSVCELEALAIGPDLARGTAVFRRVAAAGPGRAATAAPLAVAAAEARAAGAGV